MTSHAAKDIVGVIEKFAALGSLDRGKKCSGSLGPHALLLVKHGVHVFIRPTTAPTNDRRALLVASCLQGCEIQVERGYIFTDYYLPLGSPSQAEGT